jgi:radical S-adenosyl methionine domain-containing protein 2
LDSLFKILSGLKEAGFSKINFAGGEPFLYREILGEMVQFAYEIGLTTSIVTNGTLLTKEWLEKYGRFLNWIAVSCDSADEATQKELGRGNGNQVKHTKQAFELIKAFNTSKKTKNPQIRTKLNSVITSLNWQENMTEFVLHCGVERWKVLQVLYIQGENDDSYPSLAITQAQFAEFVQCHKLLEESGVTLVSENNEMMEDSYIMIDPKGCFFQNSKNAYQQSSPILEVGVLQALQEVGFSEEKFLKRGGSYDF